jgi:2-oxoglutarate ferredoxin oxidoreductase subunit delta
MHSENASDGSEAEPKGKVILTEDRCKGCTYCIEFCPTKALAQSTRLNHKGYRIPELAHPEKCTGCDTCGLFCPDFAIFGVRLEREKKGE